MENDDDIFDELEEKFNRAAEFVQKATTTNTGNKPSQDVMLQIYGLYKTATIGKCTDSKPGLFDPRGRAKWTAWNNVSKLSKETAMSEYIKLISNNYDWDPLKVEKHPSGNSSSFGGNAVSSFPIPNEDDHSDSENVDEIIFRWIKQNDIEEVTKWINQPGNNINSQDQDGLTLLHWAVDRGHLELCKLLLENNANPSIQESEGQTPLDYAITCDHDSIIILLQSVQNVPH